MNVLARLRGFDAAKFRAPGLALASLAFVCTVLAFATPCFIESDDATIMDFAVQGDPVPYTGILFTRFLHFAYEWAPAMPWYGLSLYALHVLCLFLWLSLVWRAFRPGWLAATVGLAVLAYYIRELTFLDYTSTSVMLCASSVGWTLLDVLERRQDWWRHAVLGLVFTLGILVRPQAAVGTLAFLLPAALWVMLLRLRGRSFRLESRQLAWIAFVFFVPALCNLAADRTLRAYAMTPQEVQYEAFNTARGHFFRVNVTRRMALLARQPVLDSIHWSRQDFMRLHNWTMLDERIYTPQALQVLVDNMPPPRTGWADLAAVLARNFSPTDPYFLLLLSPLPLLLLGLRGRCWPETLGFALPAYCVLLVTFMAVAFTFINRVEFPYVTAFGLVSLLLTGWIMRSRDEVAPRLYAGFAVASAIIVLAGAMLAIYDEGERRPATRLRADLLHEKLQVLDQDYAGSVILVQSDAGLTFQALSPLENVSLGFQPIQLGWSTFSPRFYRQIGALGVQHGYQVIDALIGRPGAYLLGYRAWGDEVVTYASARDKRELQVVEVRRFGDGTRLMRLEEKRK